MKWQMRFPNGAAKAVTLSFDDGVHEDIPVTKRLKELGLHATFNLNSGLFPPDDIDEEKYREGKRLTRADCIRIFSDPAFELAVHTCTHPGLPGMREEDVRSQITNDRIELEKMAGVPVRGMAYPYGVFDEATEKIARECGIVYSRTVASHYDFAMPEDWLAWGPTCHYCEPDIPGAIDEFLSLKPESEPKLFYLWGHSYECTLNGNWEVLYGYLERLSGKNDIWYATNLEVCDYASAFERLEFSADESLVHNPSALDIWISDGKKTALIPCGGTVKL